LLQSLRKRLGITQKELAILAGVTVGAAHLWEIGKFKIDHWITSSKEMLDIGFGLEENSFRFPLDSHLHLL
jgi:transcriptional regulator with XRE-family HTH domain